MRRMLAGCNGWKVTMASSRLMNSGRNRRLTAASAAETGTGAAPCSKPMWAALISAPPALEVIASTVWWKSARRPLPSVSEA